jgi:RNA 3'-terminal phosphate cyclase (ATP)
VKASPKSQKPKSEASIGFGRIEFVPNQLQEGDFFFDIGTAGSTTLVLKLSCLLAYAPGGVIVRVKGGQNNPFAPQ